MIQKQTIPINFAQGLDQKSDPKQIPVGKFASMVNRVFTNDGLLTKRNGFGEVTSLSNATSLTTFQGGLVTIGQAELQAYSQELGAAENEGFFQPCSLEVLPIVRSANSQTTVDVAISSSGIACATWLESNGTSYYQVLDTSTGQIITAYVALPSTATASRVFVLGQYFIVTYLATISAATHLQYIAVPIKNSGTPAAAVDVSTSVGSLTYGYDGISYNNNLYLAWGTASTTIQAAYLTSSLQLSSTTTISNSLTQHATLMSLTVDSSVGNTAIWVTWWSTALSEISTMAFNATLSSTQILGPTSVVTSVTVNELTTTANNNTVHIFYEVANTYSFSPNAKTDYISKTSCTTSGTTGTPKIILRNVGLGSKAVLSSALSKSYMLASYGQTFQPTYYLIDDAGNVLSKFAYSNGGGYAVNQVLPQMILTGSQIQVGYLFKDLVQAVNKSQGVAAVAGVYSNLGINLITLMLSGSTQSVEIGGGLHLNGGFLWEYDGVKPVEHNFFVWPEDIQATWSSTGGSMAAQPGGSGGGNTNVYYYQVTYEWTDASGNVHRSAPSVPFGVTTTGSGTAGSVTLNLPTLRQTYKTVNLVRIVIYRWSAGQQEYFQVTSVASPQLNSTTVDSITYTDTLADSSIVGNALIYTTGGVVEDVGAPSAIAMTLFDDRLWIISAEDGTLWYSKQVLQATPVEMSDLFTYYVAPSIGSSGSTGQAKCVFPMDDKLIVFKQNAIYYINGSGPDNTGANSQYSQPIFITSTIGCSNQSSIVFTPMGLMFQSENGIWLLGRDLSTTYIGKEVQGYNGQTVTSSVAVPGTTHVRFTLDNTQALMFDYYYEQWGTFSNVNAIASTLYENLHTYLDPYGRILQETPGEYLDVSTPVTTSFTTGWINLASLQGFERFYNFYILGQYITPHKLGVGIAYDYNPAQTQFTMINPLNFSGVFGSDPLYGDQIPYGGITPLEQWRIFPQQQKCQSFQITVTEYYDPSFGILAGAGLTISGLNMTMGMKKGSRPIPARQSAG
jgi:hypothetical protein